MIATRKRVLVVDDEDVVCRSYERVLEQAGFEVGKAHSGPEALAKVRDRDYDVMLADLKMPGMDGLQVVEQLRGTHPALPVVVITGFPSQDTLQQAARLGVTDYLTKPVPPDVLTQATMQALTAPAWQGSMSTPQLAAADVDVRSFPERLPEGTLVWPEQAVAVPVAVPIDAVVDDDVAEVPAVAVEVAEEEEQGGALRTVWMLVTAPVISLAYVMFLPFLGLAMFVGLGTKALARKLGGAR